MGRRGRPKKVKAEAKQPPVRKSAKDPVGKVRTGATPMCGRMDGFLPPYHRGAVVRLTGTLFAMAVALLFAATLAADAQPAGKVPRIGLLSPSSPSDAGRNPSDLAVLFGAFRESLRELGYVEGQNIWIESRWAEGNYDRLPVIAAELVGLKVGVIVTYGTPASLAAKRATGTIPIVMAGIIDPVASGLITNLARPGGNLTGNSMMSPDLAEKQLEVLKEVVPKISRVALLHNPANP